MPCLFIQTVQSCQNHKLMSTVQLFQVTTFTFSPIQAVTVCKKEGGELRVSSWYLASIRLIPTSWMEAWSLSLLSGAAEFTPGHNQQLEPHAHKKPSQHLVHKDVFHCCCLGVYLLEEPMLNTAMQRFPNIESTQDPKAMEPHCHEISPEEQVNQPRN